MVSDKRFEFLLCQYRECLAFIRNYTSAIWQIPSITMAINTFLAITYLEYTETHETRVVILVVALVFTFVSTIQLKKHRFFQEAKGDEFRWIQAKLCETLQETKGKMREIKLKTDEIWCDREAYPTVSRTAFTLRGAYNWFLGTMYASILTIYLLLLYEIGLLILTLAK
ncbi:MAG: hypothetical protein OEY88_03265 [Candidatus Bathyarchaeota archaeon]|nr:hypothetical protein [Candidatus Bathyarchaeota archaeon]